MALRRSCTTLFAALVLWGCEDTSTDAERTSPVSSTEFCEAVEAATADFLAASEWTPPAAEADRYGGTAVIAGGAELVSGMNGFTTTDIWSRWTQNEVLFLTLVELDENFEYMPRLAESWEIVDDSTAVVFTLRDDVSWHDGTPTTAEDVAFTFRTATRPETAYPNPGYWSFYRTGPEAVEVLDSRTVRIAFEPHLDWLDTWANVPIMPAHLLGSVDPADFRGHPFTQRCPVGNGPFRMVEHRDSDRWIWERNPRFPDGLGGPPRLDRLVYRIIPDQTTTLAELLGGEVDFYAGVPVAQAEAVREAEGASLHSYRSREFNFIAWNLRRPQLSDPRVRRALTLAIDREELVDIYLDGFGVVANATTPPGHFAYDPALESALAHDPAEARRLLDAAGWRDRDGDGVRENAEGEPLSIGLTTNLGSQERGEILQLLQRYLGDVGVEIALESREFGVAVQAITNPESRDFDAVFLSFFPDFRMDDTGLFHSGSAGSPMAFAGLQDPVTDSLLDAIRAATSREEALPYWRAYQQRLLEMQPFTFLYYDVQLIGVADRLRGVEVDARNELVTVTDWWIAPDEGAAPGRGGR